MPVVSQTSKKTVIVVGVDIITETQAFPQVILIALQMTPTLTHSGLQQGFNCMTCVAVVIFVTRCQMKTALNLCFSLYAGS